MTATTEYRYSGDNTSVNNYINFNNETWRIIGVFEIEDENGNKEERVKIIREKPLNVLKAYGGSYGRWIDRPTSSDHTYYYLNSDYYKSIDIDYQKLIGETKYYLGGTSAYTTITPKTAYTAERGDARSTSYPQNVITNIGLMYASDYGYAADSSCDSTAIYNFSSNCSSKDWLYTSVYTNGSDYLYTGTSKAAYEWFLTAYTSSSYAHALIVNSGSLTRINYTSSCLMRPTLYLKSDTMVNRGTGTKGQPYELKLERLTDTEKLIKKVGTGGLISETYPATTQLGITTDYRYTGENPDNYITFNNETWRIIGIFNVDDGSSGANKGKIEKRLKIVRDTIGNIEWNTSVFNNWSQSSAMTLLNEGDYYNQKGTYALNGLTNEAKNQIANAKWYLGGTMSDYSNSLTSVFYSAERGETVYNNNPKYWIGKVAIMYVSDFGYATDGGLIDRVSCLNTALKSWQSSSYSECKRSNWLYDNNNNQWTLNTTYASYGEIFSIMKGNDYIISTYSPTATHAMRPTVYLKSDISIIKGEGTSTSPYEIK